MKVEFHIKDIIISNKQKDLIEQKIKKLKRYIKDEPLLIDVYLTDETSLEKGGVDQSVELSTVVSNEKIFIKEIDNRLMRAFAKAYKAFERNLSEFHRKRIDKTRKVDESSFNKVLRALKLKK